MNNLGMMRGMMEDFQFIVFDYPEEDGLFGKTGIWTEGERFKAMVTPRGSGERTVGEQRGLGEQFNVVVELGVTLKYMDVIKRIGDGAVFRITNNPINAPGISSVAISAATAERWELPL